MTKLLRARILEIYTQSIKFSVGSTPLNQDAVEEELRKYYDYNWIDRSVCDPYRGGYKEAQATFVVPRRKYKDPEHDRIFEKASSSVGKDVIITVDGNKVIDIITREEKLESIEQQRKKEEEEKRKRKEFEKRAREEHEIVVEEVNERYHNDIWIETDKTEAVVPTTIKFTAHNTERYEEVPWVANAFFEDGYEWHIDGYPTGECDTEMEYTFEEPGEYQVSFWGHRRVMISKDESASEAWDLDYITVVIKEEKEEEEVVTNRS